MRFLVYVPQARGVGALSDVGLSHMIPNAAEIEVDPGPDGRRGIVFSWPTNDVPPLGFIPDRQEWVPAVATDLLPSHRYWVGFTKGFPPQPHELAWPKQFGGQFVQLGDGQHWRFPAAGMLPQVMRMEPDRRVVWQVRSEYQDYFEKSAQWYQRLILIGLDPQVGEVIQFDASVFDYLTGSLSLNYALTTEVISHLGLLGTDNLLSCLRATLDGLAIQTELDEKKKAD